MTAMSRQRNRAARLAGACCATVVALSILAGSTLAATTEAFVTDRHSGLALSGFDPVAYFTDGAARQGTRDYEYAYRRVTWRFRNEGNLAAFAAAPDIYAPQYGGYDPISAARGVGAPGHPALFIVHNRRLYLFYTPESRTEFAADPEGSIARATQGWPAVLRTLVP